MKSYSDLEQSKKLAKILPIESADMYYSKHSLENYYSPIPHIGVYSYIHNDIPCWSLTALLNILPCPILSKDKLGGDKCGWMVSVYPDNCRYDSCWHSNSIDACVEMIFKLYELNLL